MAVLLEAGLGRPVAAHERAILGVEPAPPVAVGDVVVEVGLDVRQLAVDGLHSLLRLLAQRGQHPVAAEDLGRVGRPFRGPGRGGGGWSAAQARAHHAGDQARAQNLAPAAGRRDVADAQGVHFIFLFDLSDPVSSFAFYPNAKVRARARF